MFKDTSFTSLGEEFILFGITVSDIAEMMDGDTSEDAANAAFINLLDNNTSQAKYLFKEKLREIINAASEKDN